MDSETENKHYTAIDRYIEDLFLEDDPALDAAIQSIHDAGMPQISIYPNLGAFLRLMVRITKAKRVLEIGTLGGYSSIWLARGLPADGTVVTIELEKDYAAIAQKNIERAGEGDKVDLRIGDAIVLMESMIQAKEGNFDIVFLDAYKPSYTQYLELALSLVHSGSIIIADNVIFSGEVLHPDDEVARGTHRFNAALAEHPKLEATILTNVSQKGLDGIAIAVVK